MKPVGQCLTTAVMASALFDLYMLHPVDASPVEPEEATSTADQADASESTPTPVEAIAPPEIINPVASAPSAPVVEQPVAAEPVTAPDVSEQAEGNGPASTTTPDAMPTEAVVDSEAATSVEAQPSGEVTPTATASPTAQESRVEAIRQQLADEMQTLLDRDRPQREAQLKQNLIATALHYAQLGQAEQAQQLAQHPIFSLEEQADLLAQIEKLLVAQLKQPPVIALEGTAQPAVPTGYPGTVVALPHAWSTGRFSVVRPTWGASCPVAVAQPSGGAAAATAASVPQAAVQPLSIKAAALDLSQFKPTETLQSEQQFTLQNTADLPNMADGQLSSALKSVNKLPKPEQTALDLELGQMVGSALTGVLDKVGVKPAVVLPSSVSTALGWWFEPTIYQGEEWVTNGQSLVDPSSAVNLSEEARLAAAELTQTPLLKEVENALFADLAKSSQIAGTAASHLKVAQPENQTVMVKMTQAALAATNCGSTIPAANFSLGDAVRSILPQQLRNVEMLFPLPIPAALTSAFGWRIHPISGQRRFHAGIDLGAPTGTPVLAAVSGRVVAADYMGGYGLAIVIENDNAPQRNLYAHLSGIAVTPGMRIEQGSVIGWVGSTGNSTGPHLHFETHALTTSGWEAINPLAASLTTASAGQ